MPCNSITIQSVVLHNAMQPLVKDALEARGWTILNSTADTIRATRGGNTVVWKKGKGMTLSGMRVDKSEITKLTKEYSKQAVTWASQRAGWQVKSTSDNTLTMTRR